MTEEQKAMLLAEMQNEVSDNPKRPTAIEMTLDPHTLRFVADWLGSFKGNVHGITEEMGILVDVLVGIIQAKATYIQRFKPNKQH